LLWSHAIGYRRHCHHHCYALAHHYAIITMAVINILFTVVIVGRHWSAINIVGWPLARLAYCHYAAIIGCWSLVTLAVIINNNGGYCWLRRWRSLVNIGWSYAADIGYVTSTTVIGICHGIAPRHYASLLQPPPYVTLVILGCYAIGIAGLVAHITSLVLPLAIRRHCLVGGITAGWSLAIGLMSYGIIINVTPRLIANMATVGWRHGGCWLRRYTSNNTALPRPLVGINTHAAITVIVNTPLLAVGTSLIYTQ